MLTTPCTFPAIIHPYLAKGSQVLVDFDVRMPVQFARRRRRGSNLSPLPPEDWLQPASQPPKQLLRIYLPEHRDWRIYAQCSGSGGAQCVTVRDVLQAIYDMLAKPAHTQASTMSADPQLMKAFRRRCNKAARLRLAQENDALRKGMVFADWLLSKNRFAGLSLERGTDGKDWWKLETESIIGE